MVALRTSRHEGTAAGSERSKLDETLSDAAKRVTASHLFALRFNARPRPQLLLQPGACGTFHIVKAWIEAGITQDHRQLRSTAAFKASVLTFARPAFILLSVHALGFLTNTSLFNCVHSRKLSFFG